MTSFKSLCVLGTLLMLLILVNSQVNKTDNTTTTTTTTLPVSTIQPLELDANISLSRTEEPDNLNITTTTTTKTTKITKSARTNMTTTPDQSNTDSSGMN